METAPRLTDSIDQARGPMLAAAIGDALGWPIENRSGRVGGITRVEARLELIDWVRREGGRYAPHEVEVGPGSYSDDTQLTLAVARSRLRGADWWAHWTECELPLWLVYERGGGGASKRAAQAWSRGHSPWSEEAKPADVERYLKAGGNGAAMRIMPHVLLGASGGFEPIATAIVADGICTHGHPRALVGALAQGYALWLALRQEAALGFGELVDRTLEDEDHWGRAPTLPAHLDSWISRSEAALPNFALAWERTREEMRALLTVCRDALARGSLAVDRKTLDEIGAFDKQSNGAGTIAAAAAVFLASRYAPQPGVGLTAAAFAKGADTDTIAAMTGSILGAIDNNGWLASLASRLQDARYIEDLAAKLVQDGLKPMPVGAPWRQTDRRRLLKQLSGEIDGEPIALPALGACEVIESRELPSKSSSRVFEWKLATAEGQTLYVKRVASNASKKEVARTDEPGEKRRGKAPFWLVLKVADLTAARRFYADELQLAVTSNGDPKRLYVTDRIVLEKAAQQGRTIAETRTDEKALLGHSEAITLFRARTELEQLHARLLAADVPISKLHDQGGRMTFRCADPDGHVVEVRADEVTPSQSA
jgi:ADP-ribosylglycohydrolase/catechol 2,3-dioxygenase-like lactoylglutathione lyase family enzyme